MKRRILGTFQKADTSPVSNTMGFFSLNTFSHDSLTFYSKENVFFWTNQNGEIVAQNPSLFPANYAQPLGVELVVTNSLDIPVVYSCVVDGTGIAFDFLLPSGTTTVQLQDLESSTIEPQTPRYNSLLAYIDGIVDSAIVDVVAGKNKKIITETYTADAVLSSMRVIKIPSKQYADCRNIADINVVKAFTESATTINHNFEATITGKVLDVGWNWSTNQPIFLGYNGQISQNIQSDSVFVQQIATALSPIEVFISFQEPIKL